MKITEIFPSKYLRSDDLQTDTLVTISAIKMEEVGPDKKPKPTIYFRELAKPLIANKTNCTAIAGFYGDDCDLWPGKKIVLIKSLVDFRGEQVESIRVRAPRVKKPVVEPEYDGEGAEESV